MVRKIRHNYNLYSHYTYYVPGVSDMFILLAWLILGSILANILSLVALFFKSVPDITQYATLVAYPVMFIPAMMYASAKSRNNCLCGDGIAVDSSHFGGKGLLCALVAFVGTLSVNFISDPMVSLLPKMPDFLKEMLEQMTSGNIFVNLLMVSIFAPIFEEWLCRGMVLRGLLNNKVKPFWAIVISAAFFAVIHANPWQAIPAFLMGVLFGYVYYKTGSIKLTMFMHFVNNTMAVVLSHIFPQLSVIESWRDVIPEQYFWLIFACCVLLAALSVLFFSHIKLERKEGNCDSVASLFNE